MNNSKFAKLAFSIFLAFSAIIPTSAISATSAMATSASATSKKEKQIFYSYHFYPFYPSAYIPYIALYIPRHDGISIDVERDIFGGAYINIRGRGGRFTYKKYIPPQIIAKEENKEENKEIKEEKEESKEEFLNEEESDRVIEEWLNKKNLLHVINPKERYADVMIVNGKQIPYEREFSVDAKVFEEQSGTYKYILYWSKEDNENPERKNLLQKTARKMGFRVLVYDKGYYDFLGDNTKSKAYIKNILYVFPASTKKDLEKRIEENFPPPAL